MHTNLKTVSGCATRLTVTVTAPEGADKTLTAYCRCCGDSHPATVEGDTVTFPPLPAGEHLFELRAGGVPVIHGHLIARPSAFPVPPMHTVDHTVTADLDGTTVANLSVTLNQGARGPQGEPGAPGEAPRLPWEMTTGVGDSNANVATMVLHQKYLTPGLLTEVSIMARPNNTAGQGVAMQVLQQQEGGGNDPEGWELLGTSTNAVNQVFNTYGTWEFDGIILAAGRPVCFKTVNADGASTNIGLKGFGRPADDTVSCIRAASGTSANYIPQAIIRMRQDAAAALADTNAALAAHREDSTAHVTAGEHAVLANAAQGALWVPGSTGSVTLAGQQGDGVAVSAANNTSRVQVQNSGVTITAPNAPQWLEAGDTPAFYNIRTAKDLTATDESIAAAMAAKQDALTAGDGISIDGNVISATTPPAPDLSSYATKADLASSTEYLVTVGSEFAEGVEPVGRPYPYYSAVNEIMGSSNAIPPSYMFQMTITGVAPAGTSKRIAAIRVRAGILSSGTPARLFLVRSGYTNSWVASNSKQNISSIPYFASELLQPSAESCNQDVVLYPCNGEDATFEDLFESSFVLGVGESPEAVRFSGARDGYSAYFAIVPRSSGDMRADTSTPYLAIKQYPGYSITPIKFDLVETVKTRQAATNTAVAALEARIAALEAAQAGEAET